MELNAFRFNFNFDFGHDLKILGDPYGRLSNKEVKGSRITLNYEYLWITSNYHPSEMTDDEKLLLAIYRRFSIFECFNLNPYEGRP